MKSCLFALGVILLLLSGLSVVALETPIQVQRDFPQYILNKSFNPNISSQAPGLNCDKMGVMNKKMMCRLELKEKRSDRKDACRYVTEKKECNTLFNLSQECEQSVEKEKDKCFKKIAKESQIIKSKKKETRFYISLLLSDLFRRVEDAYDKKRITSDEASMLMSEIVSLEQKVLMNHPPGSIRRELENFKKKWREVMQ